MAKPNLIFYDMKSNVPSLSISPNTWRVRLVLNYKNLPYETIWCEPVDITKTLSAADIPPYGTRANGSPRYTLPSLIDLSNPDAPFRLCDSRKIIAYLEATYPSPDPQRVLFPPGTHAFQMLADKYVEDIIQPLSWKLAIFAAVQKQTEYSRASFEKYHTKPGGKTLEEEHPRGKEREEAWARLRTELDKLATYAEGDVFFSGESLRYFDVHMLARFVSMKVSLGDEITEELRTSAGGRWTRLMDTCAELVR